MNSESGSVPAYSALISAATLGVLSFRRLTRFGITLILVEALRYHSAAERPAKHRYGSRPYLQRSAHRKNPNDGGYAIACGLEQVIDYIKNLKFSYSASKIKAIDDISLSIEKGEYVAILGNNGSGKSTLLKSKVTEEEIQKVVSKWTGIPVTKMVEGERQKLLNLEK